MVFLNIDGVLFAWFATATAKDLYPEAWRNRAALAFESRALSAGWVG